MKEKIETELDKIVKKTTTKRANTEWKSAIEDSKEAPFNYRYDHVKQVVRLCTTISIGMNVRKHELMLSAWLHDIEKPGIGGAKKHAQKSGRKAESVLEKLGICAKEITIVRDIIEKHVGLVLKNRLEPIEAQILWEADKLVKLGITGLIHFLINGLIMNPGHDMQDIANEIDDYLHLAEDIVSGMYTGKSKSMGVVRLKHMKLFQEMLRQELNSIEGN